VLGETGVLRPAKYTRQVIIYTDSGWPLWLRALITIFAAALVAMMGWRYYKRYWRR
jgi:hypothetical protein